MLALPLALPLPRPAEAGGLDEAAATRPPAPPMSMGPLNKTTRPITPVLGSPVYSLGASNHIGASTAGGAGGIGRARSRCSRVVGTGRRTRVGPDEWQMCHVHEHTALPHDKHCTSDDEHVTGAFG